MGWKGKGRNLGGMYGKMKCVRYGERGGKRIKELDKEMKRVNEGGVEE